MKEILILMLTAFLVPIVIRVMSGANKQSVTVEDGKCLTFTIASKVTMSLITALLIGVTMLANIFPGRTDRAVLPLVTAFFLIAALLALWTTIFMFYSKVVYNQHSVKGPDWLGREISFNWEDMLRVEYVGWANCLRLLPREGKSIWISIILQGFKEFEEFLLAEMKRRNLLIEP
ncbi:hypothetical protein GC174_16295 [bacterium]|nr:hypothetical protein [bacterium]